MTTTSVFVVRVPQDSERLSSQKLLGDSDVELLKDHSKKAAENKQPEEENAELNYGVAISTLAQLLESERK